MSSEIMTSWSAYQGAVERLLALTEHELLVYDHNLARLRFETAAGTETLKRIIGQGQDTCIRIALRDATYLREAAPRLMNLLRNHGHRMSICETPETLSHLRDSVLIADGKHALVLFEQEQARSKLIIDDVSETRSHRQRFEEIWQSGGSAISATTIGL